MTLETDIAVLTATPGFSGDVIPKGDPSYTKAIARWSLTSIREANLVVYPKDATSISVTITWATSRGFPLAVKGGGHSQSGASSIEDGVVIDLEGYLGGVRVDPDTKRAFIGGGAIWETVNEETIKYGLATVGGTVSHTGVGGLILGGGYGYLAGEHGLVIDNLLEATIVTADGSIIKASPTSHEDLFWGIRGGGGNFGVVTEFVLRLHQQRETVFGGILVFPVTSPEIVQKIYGGAAEWAGTISTKDVLSLIMAVPPEVGSPVVMALVFHNGTEEEGRQVFKWLYDLSPASDSATTIPYPIINTLNNPLANHGLCYYTSSLSHNPVENALSAAVLSKVTSLNETSKQEGIPVNYATIVEYYNTKKVQEVSSDATAFPIRSDKCNAMVLAVWEKNDPQFLEAARKGAAEIRQEFSKAQGETGIFYTNFDSEDRVPPSKVELMFKDKYPRLQKIKARHDPNEVFSRWYGIKPASP